MHKQWQDLLPYYIAGTLPRSSAAELERHLTGCDSCRRALNEWQMVAGVVQNQAEEWSIQAPPLAPELRFHNLRPSSNGFGHTSALAEMQEKTIRVMPEPRKAAARSQRLPLTMVAAVLVVVLSGIALIFLSRQNDDESASPGARPTNQVLLRTVTATSTRTRTPLGTPLPMSSSPSLSTPTPFRLDPTTQGLQATPAALYGSEIGMGGYRLITLTDVGEIPANTRVRISHAWYTGTGWMYGISTENDTLYAEAREWQIGYASDSGPGPTPTAQYGSSIGVGGYPFLTTVSVGSVPANTRVRISSAYYGANGWVYQVVAQDEVSTGDAYDWQLSAAPDQGGPTPYPLFENGLDVSGYPMRTVVQVGDIPAESRVRINSAWYTTAGWV
ncbi:MAG TPA: zf-HC2 domain-containing protein [Aggregatilineaceae bacterium]|nr:zf-HC2 domain-containing protein [Aggregatilineaceae bacterium]